MLIRRCAWHPKYHGTPLVIGVTDRDRPGVAYTDGLCADCAARWRATLRKETS